MKISEFFPVSLLAASVWQRLALVLIVAAVLWGGVFWALEAA